MKYYKVTNNEFDGFYDKEIHRDILFDINTVNSLSTEGESHEVIELRDSYFELEEERWQELLEGQSEGGEIRILKNGELGLYQVPGLEEDMINPIFDYDKEVWVEQATEEEQLKYWEDKMIANQTEINLRGQVGLAPTKEQIEFRDKVLARHRDICHTMALKMND